MTVRLSVVECEMLPEVPVILTVAGPTVAVEVAASVSIDVALPPDAGVTAIGENEAVTPLGRPEALNVVAALNPFRLPTVSVLVALAP